MGNRELSEWIYKAGDAARMVIEYAEKISTLEASLTAAVELMQTFVDRVDRGEVRSVKTYAAFKQFLASSPAHAARKILDVVDAAHKVARFEHGIDWESSAFAEAMIHLKAVLSAQKEEKTHENI